MLSVSIQKYYNGLLGYHVAMFKMLLEFDVIRWRYKKMELDLKEFSFCTVHSKCQITCKGEKI